MSQIKHVAMIMDGNGRWAKKRGMPRTYGHRKGEDTVKLVIEECYKRGIETLSLFAFSTENWKRDKEEIDTLFDILRKFLKRFSKTAIEREFRIEIMGDITKLPNDLQESILDAVAKTANFRKLTINIGLNYGGRDEIVHAVNQAIKNGELVDEESFAKLLYTKDLTDPDLLIRTSGEQRMSNFMLYQCAYSEMYFTDVLWPDFDKNEFDKAIEWYNSRNRRFGKI